MNINYFVIIFTALIIVSVIEYFFAAEKGHTVQGRLRNVGHLIILHLLGITVITFVFSCLLYTSPSPRDQRGSRMPSSA